MNTNHWMLNELLKKYKPSQRGILSSEEYELVKETLCVEEMDVLQLRNLRDFTVAHMGHSKNMDDWDKLSAITYVIDSHICKLGGEV